MRQQALAVWIVASMVVLGLGSSERARADQEPYEGPMAIDYSGTYKITKGVFPTKKKYQGTVVMKVLGGIETLGFNRYEVTWPSDSGGYAGVGWDLGDRFAVGYGIGANVGVLAFGKSPDGKLAILGELDVGDGTTVRFHATGKKLKKGKFAGTWKLTDANHTDLGTLKIKKRKKAFDIKITLPDGSFSNGVAVTAGKALHFATNGSGAYGIVSYAIKSTETGMKLVGTWAIGDGNGKLGAETIEGPQP